MKDRRHIAVLGLGTFGKALALELTRMGDRVLGIDTDPGIVAAMDGQLDVVIQADASDSKVLEHAGIDGYDAAIVAIGDDMQASLLTAMNVMANGCSAIYVKAQSPEHAQILRAMGVANLLEPEQSFARRTAQKLHNPRVEDFIDLGNGNYVAALRAPTGSDCRTIPALKLEKYKLVCVGIDIGERILTEDIATHEISLSDKLILVGKRPDLRRFALSG